MKKILFSLLFVLGCTEEPTIQKLIVDVKPVNGGIVSQSYGEYQLNEEISLIASSNSEFEFNNWSGDYLSNNNPLDLVIDKDISRQALYDSSLISGDGLHPSGKMYALWVDRVIEYVSNLKY